MPHNPLKMSEAGSTQGTGPQTPSACVCSPVPHPGMLDEHLDRRMASLVPESHMMVGFMGGDSLSWDMDMDTDMDMDMDITPMFSVVQTSLCCCYGYSEPVIGDIFKYLKTSKVKSEVGNGKHLE